MSHFAVLVVGEVEHNLAPFHEFECTGTDNEFVQDVDQTEEARALSYLANVDPNVRRALLANGLAEKPSQRKARLAAEAEDAPAKNARPSQTVRCPAGSAWDGKGCWAKNLKAVSR